ncbi:hypothetical protein [Nocardiopsis oceani]
MHAGPSDRPEREGGRDTDAHPRRRADGEPDNARRITFTIALVVTFAFLLVTAAGLGWFLSDNGPLSDSPTAADTDDEGAEDEADGAEEDSGAAPDPVDEDTVTDSEAGLTYDLPGDAWERLGDDQVPAEYTSYAVYGSADDPDAVIITGTEDLGPLEPIAVSGVSLALDTADDLVTDVSDLRAEPSGDTEVDGLPAFGVTMGGSTDDGEESYGRFLVVELDGDQGAFMLGLNTGGGDEATAEVDSAFDSVGTL